MRLSNLFSLSLVVPLFLLFMGNQIGGAVPDISELLKEGAQLGKEGKNEKAVEKFQAVLEQEPRHEKAHYFLVILNWKLGKKNLAVQEYLIVKGLNPQLAKKLREMNPDIDPAEAKGTSPETTPREPIAPMNAHSDPKPGPQNVSSDDSKGPTGAASEPGNQEMTGIPGLEKIRELEAAGQSDEALKELKDLLAKNRGNPGQIQFQMGTVYEGMGKTDEAVKAFSNAYYKGINEAMYRMACLYRKENNLEKCKTSLHLIEDKDDEWGRRAKEELELLKEETKDKKEDGDGISDLEDKARFGTSDEEREAAARDLLKKDSKSETALMTLKEVCANKETVSGLAEARDCIRKMIKYGYVTESNGEAEINELCGPRPMK